MRCGLGVYQLRFRSGGSFDKSRSLGPDVNSNAGHVRMNVTFRVLDRTEEHQKRMSKMLFFG